MRACQSEIEDEPIHITLGALIKKHAEGWSGTASDLLTAITIRQKLRTPQELLFRLRLAQQQLRSSGIAVVIRKHGGERVIEVKTL